MTGFGVDWLTVGIVLVMLEVGHVHFIVFIFGSRQYRLVFKQSGSCSKTV